jgi:hypothetical protein
VSEALESKRSEVTFVKGQSGNPGGVHKGTAELKALARQHAPAAIETLAAIMSDSLSPPAARVGAANALLDRGYGKPVQEIVGADGGPLLGSIEVRYVKPAEPDAG